MLVLEFKVLESEEKLEEDSESEEMFMESKALESEEKLEESEEESESDNIWATLR